MTAARAPAFASIPFQAHDCDMQRSNATFRVLALVCVAATVGCGDDDRATTSGAPAVVDSDAPRVDCDPLQQDCLVGRACTLVGNSFQCVAIAVDGAEGDACKEESECGLGLACLAAIRVPACEGFKCCTPLCELDEDDYTCPGAAEGARCAPALTGDVPTAHRDYGVCRL